MTTACHKPRLSPNISIKFRKCMTCTVKFLSEGPGNRICKECNRKSDHGIRECRLLQ